MTRVQVRFLAVVFLFSCLSLPAGTAAGEEGDDEWVNKPAPAFELKDLAGNDLRLGDLVRENVVWLNFWGLRCGPCVRELPALQKLYETHKEKGLVVIGVNTDGVDAGFISKALVERADLKAAGVSFPIAPDPEFAAVDAYGLLGAPLNVMIDRQGIVRFRHEGYEAGDELGYAEVLEKLLVR